MSSVHGLPSRVAVTEFDPSADAGIAVRRSWREILAITIAVPVAVFCIHPGDPLLLNADFPWLVLIPLLLGAQHGALAAAASSALLFALAWAYDMYLGRLDVGTLAAWGGGCLAAGIIAGHFRDRIEARLTHLGRQVEEDAERLARLSRAHSIVKLSHQRLEEHLSAQGWSLESAIEETRKVLDAEGSLPALCESILNVLSNHAMVQAASLFTVVSNSQAEGESPDLALAAKLGNPPSVDARQRLIERALATRHLVALDVEAAEVGRDEPVLAAVPLLAGDGRLLGVIAVHEMPFMAFQTENLNSLAALSAHLADVLQARLEPASREKLKLHALDGTSLDFSSAAPEAVAPANEFVGTRTGTHRRRDVRESA